MIKYPVHCIILTQSFDSPEQQYRGKTDTSFNVQPLS